MATLKDIQTDTAKVFRRVEAEGLEPVTRHGKLIAVVVSADRLSSLVETLELQADPELMKAVREHRAGRMKFTPLPDADED